MFRSFAHPGPTFAGAAGFWLQQFACPPLLSSASALGSFYTSRGWLHYGSPSPSVEARALPRSLGSDPALQRYRRPACYDPDSAIVVRTTVSGRFFWQQDHSPGSSRSRRHLPRKKLIWNCCAPRTYCPEVWRGYSRTRTYPRRNTMCFVSCAAKEKGCPVARSRSV